MKLVLFSDYIYASDNRLIDLIGKTEPTIGYISSCPDPSRQYYEEMKKYYAQMGASVTPYIDLELGFDRDSIDRIFQADAIHLPGGNTFQFYYWIIQRRLKRKLLDYANSGKVIIGVSAGAIIMTPDISYAEFCGDRNDVNLQELKGLGLVNFCFIPHAEDTLIAQNVIVKSRQDNSRVLVVGDSDYIFVKDSEIQVYGQPKLLVNGEIIDSSYIQ